MLRSVRFSTVPGTTATRHVLGSLRGAADISMPPRSGGQGSPSSSTSTQPSQAKSYEIYAPGEYTGSNVSASSNSNGSSPSSSSPSAAETRYYASMPGTAPNPSNSVSDPPTDPELLPPSENLPAPFTGIATTDNVEPPPSQIGINPFHTHRFYKALESSFSTPVARTLMQGTRAILIDRMNRTRRAALDTKDFDNSAYLFKAALSELRTELTMATKKDTASIRTSLNEIRKEVDILDGKLKEDVGALKHDIQMDMNTRKADNKGESAARDLAIETLHHKTIVTIGDLKTEVETAKWNNTRRGVMVILSFVMFVIVSMELAPKPPPPPPPAPPAPIVVERPLPDLREFDSEDTKAPPS